MTVYAIVNPSDPYTIDADSLMVACVATMLLGDGRYGLKTQGEETVLPLFMFGDIQQRANSWMAEQFSCGLEEALFEHCNEIADALDSVTFGTFQDRKKLAEKLDDVFDQKLEDQIRSDWHSRRSSLNDIGGDAALLATSIRRPEQSGDRT